MINTNKRIILFIGAFVFFSMLFIYGVKADGYLGIGSNGSVLINGGSVEVQGGLNVSSNNDGGNSFVTLSNGVVINIILTPEEAEAKAEENSEFGNCNENCDVEIRRVNTQNSERVVYRVSSYKDVKILGFINSNMKVSADVDVETGEVISLNKPWWVFLSSESSGEVK